MVKQSKIYAKILLGVGIFLLTFTAIWEFTIPVEFDKLDENYYHYEEQLGMNSLITENGELSEPFAHHNVYEIKVVNKNNDDIKITSRLVATNIDTGEVFLDETRFYDVNAVTKAHQSIERGFFVFPSHVEKRDYFLTFPLAFTQAIFSFVQETEIQGLSVYEFNCVSEPYDITNAIPLFRDSVVKSIYKCKIWVEPTTGQHVNFNLSWMSFFEENNQLTTLVEKGHKETTSEYVDKLVEEAKTKLLIYNIFNLFIPFSSLIIGISLITLFYMKRTQEFTETLKQQADKLKHERLATIGQLSSRLAHDLRNPLSVINTDFSILKTEHPELDKDSVERIERGIDRIDHQVQSVLNFIKLKPSRLKNHSALELLKDVLGSMSIKKDIKINLPENDSQILCDKEQCEILFYNIIFNAVQELEEKGGTLSIRIIEHDDFVIIEFEDSGLGISKENLEKIFEPLFTTKQSGTGLGLSSCKNIIKQFGGKISVKTNPTIFTLVFQKNENSKKILQEKNQI